ncbi:MAG: 30S ribosomal protein S4e [Halobacteriota archaeon]|nr:30S ribosomal protein S4e [Halobacteriota archaeon]
MSKHQKRISAPRSWPIGRKEHYWTVKPGSGPHPTEHAIPLLILIRDFLNLADNSKEAKRILHEGKVLVNGRVRKDHKFPVGIFDIISIPLIEKHYRVLTDHRGKLTFTQISEEGSKTKLCRVNDKSTVKGGKIQLNMHDGRNIIGSNDIKTKDSVIISIPDNKILKRYSFDEGNYAMVMGGKHSGEVGVIKSIKKLRSSSPNLISIQKGEKEIETVEDYVFIVGEDKLEIDLKGISA